MNYDTRANTLEIGIKGLGKTQRAFEIMRWYNCMKYRLAIAGINWKDGKNL